MGLPVLFCIENNGYGLSTPTSEQYNCKDLADRAKGYGMESHIIDGNNILEVYTKVAALAKSVRKNPRPILLEFKTFRIRGHEEASGTKYVPQDLLDTWAAKDPIENYQEFLRTANILSEEDEVAIKKDIAHEINEHWKKAVDEEQIISDISTELNDVYKEFDYQEIKTDSQKENIRFVDAVSQGLKQAMRRHDDLVLMGQDIAEYGGVFKITEGFVEEFGVERIRNTPICESAIVAAAYGLSINGMKAVMEMQFADFVSSGFNPIINLLAKSHYRWNQNADVVHSNALRGRCRGRAVS